jgi:hypothetical protein
VSLTALSLLALNGVYAAYVWRLGGALAGRGDRLAPGGGEEGEVAAGGISVIVPARNEAEALPATLRTLCAQTLPRERWELLVVDDCSRDGSAEVARVLIEELGRQGVAARLLGTTPGRSGKKEAIDLGREEARHDWVAVLDADSRPGPDWLATLLGAVRSGDGLLAGPVVFAGEGLWSRLVRLEYMGLLGAGLASFALGRPLFASGANLAWRRTAYREAGGYEGLLHLPSADDTLLIQRMRLRTRWTLAATLARGALVATRGPAGPREFWRQRVRWTSSERHMPDRAAQAGALSLYLVFLGTLLAPVLALNGHLSALAALGIVLLKLIPDLRLTVHAARRLGGRGLLPLFPLVWLGQLAYGLVVPWVGTFVRPPWRGSPAEGRPPLGCAP